MSTTMSTSSHCQCQ